MSKVNQIQAALSEIEGGRFQKLADAYLVLKGYSPIQTPGSAVASDKTVSGTPDSYVARPDGTYVFIQHTTQKQGIYAKLLDDVRKCFAENTINVSADKIREIILCHTSVLDVHEEDGLREECRTHNAQLLNVGVQPLSFDLFLHFPHLAKEFLGIEIDTHQILTLDEFVRAYDKNPLATPLGIPFHFRVDAIDEALKALAEADLLIVSGRSGVGKSRFSLECAKRYLNGRSDVAVYCVFNRDLHIFEDLKAYFCQPREYLIIVDDADRLSGFRHVLDLLHADVAGRRIKILVSVRDYALEDVLSKTSEYQRARLLELRPLEATEIKELLTAEFGIRNHLYLDRIAAIAQGNPRLAIMAARLALQEGTLESVYNVGDLYAEYFASIRQRLTQLDDPNVLKTACTVCVLRAVDRTNPEQMALVGRLTGLAPEQFWPLVQTLHGYEILDLYENEVARPSEQVLSTYLFFLGTFKEQVLDFSLILHELFPARRRLLVSALNPVLNVFGESARQALVLHIDRLRDKLIAEARADELFDFFDLFWFVHSTGALAYSLHRIRGMAAQSGDPLSLQYEPTNVGFSPRSPFHILSHFWQPGVDFENAVQLALLYVERDEAAVPEFLSLLTRNFGITLHSVHDEYGRVRYLADSLWAKAEEGRSALFALSFLRMARYWLRTTFETVGEESRDRVIFQNFGLVHLPSLLDLRRQVLQRCFSLFGVPHLRPAVLAFLRGYSHAGDPSGDRGLYIQDSETLLNFLRSDLDPNDFRQCLVGWDYLDFLHRQEIEVAEEVRQRLLTPNYRLFSLFTMERRAVRELGYSEFQVIQRQQIREELADRESAGLEAFLVSTCDIYGSLDDSERFELRTGLEMAFLVLAADREEGFVSLLRYYLATLANAARLNGFAMIRELVRIVGPDAALAELEAPVYAVKLPWLFDYFRVIGGSESGAEQGARLLALFDAASPADLPHDFDFLVRFGPAAVISVTEKLVEKAEGDPRVGHSLSFLFSLGNAIAARLADYFTGRLDLLKRAYFLSQAARSHSDHDGGAFGQILDLDPAFGREYVRWYASQEGFNLDPRNFDFLWRRSNFEELISGIAEELFAIDAHPTLLSHHPLGMFFGISGARDGSGALVSERRGRVIDNLVMKHRDDLAFISFLFLAACNLPEAERRDRIAYFLSLNDSIEDFKSLSLLPLGGSWSGSLVPHLRSQAEFIESLLPLTHDVRFVEHRQHLERFVQSIHEAEEREKKSEFSNFD